MSAIWFKIMEAELYLIIGFIRLCEVGVFIVLGINVAYIVEDVLEYVKRKKN